MRKPQLFTLSFLSSARSSRAAHASQRPRPSLTRRLSYSCPGWSQARKLQIYTLSFLSSARSPRAAHASQRPRPPLTRRLSYSCPGYGPTQFPLNAIHRLRAETRKSYRRGDCGPPADGRTHITEFVCTAASMARCLRVLLQGCDYPKRVAGSSCARRQPCRAAPVGGWGGPETRNGFFAYSFSARPLAREFKSPLLLRRPLVAQPGATPGAGLQLSRSSVLPSLAPASQQPAGIQLLASRPVSGLVFGAPHACPIGAFARV